MTLVEAFFDESAGYGTHRDADGSKRKIPILCVAGYAMFSDQAKALSADWKQTLDKKGLPYFHMVDCAHGNGEFAKLKDKPKERSAIAANMIGTIKRRTIGGFAVAVNPEQFDNLMPNHPLIGKPYTFCASLVMAAIRLWIKHVGFGGDVAYFFEAGHESKPEADRLMTYMYSDPALKAANRYVGHAFVEKIKSPPVQAADLLAWQFYTDVRRQIEGYTVHRKDFENLIDHPHHVTFITPTKMANVLKWWGWVENPKDTTWPEELLPFKLPSSSSEWAAVGEQPS